MASSYLDLYQGAGGLRQRNILGMSSPYQRPQFSFGTPQNVFYQAGQTQKVVHDQYNNKYYGTQKQSDLVKGLQDSIKRTQAQLNKDFETRYGTGWMGSLTTSTYKYTAADRKAQNAQLASQQQYLDNINNGMYKQESSTFFDSYDDHTGGWNNVFKRRKDNADTLVRNKKIQGENDLNEAKARKAAEDSSYSSGATLKPLKPNLTIGTGISAVKDNPGKPKKPINLTGLGI